MLYLYNNNYILDISNKKINLVDIYPDFIFKKNGAVVSFIGTIKKSSFGELNKIYYDIFFELAFFLLKKKLDYLTNKYGCNIYLRQYFGYLLLGDINIVIVVSSSTRSVSFDVCRSLLEYIKAIIPIWKKEFYSDNTYKWVNTF